MSLGALALATLAALPLGSHAQAAAPAPAAAASAPDLARGQRVWVMCATCHGERGEGQPAGGAPALGGQTADYVERQLRAWRAGQRGTHPDDVNGNRMRLLAKSIGSDAVVTDVSAYIATLSPAVSVQAVRGRPALGRTLYQSRCASCHGARGEGRAEVQAPRLAGLGDAYLVEQFQGFRLGWRSGPLDSATLAMTQAAASLKQDAALRDVVAYLATLSTASR